jgi:hypothetical protein
MPECQEKVKPNIGILAGSQLRVRHRHRNSCIRDRLIYRWSRIGRNQENASFNPLDDEKLTENLIRKNKALNE